MSAAVVASSTSDHNNSDDDHNVASEVSSGTKHSAESVVNGDARNSSATLAPSHLPKDSDLKPVPPSSSENESDDQSTIMDEKKQLLQQQAQQNQTSENEIASHPSLNEATGNELEEEKVGSTGNASDSGDANHSSSNATKEGGNGGAGSAPRKQKSGEPSNYQQQLNIPFPKDLLRILTEIATTGTSSWLPWKEDGNQLNGVSGTNHSTGHHTPHQVPLHRSQNHGINGRQSHQYHGISNIRSSHKRAQTPLSHSRSSMVSKNKQLHRSFYSSGGSGTTTATTMMAVESGSDDVVDSGGATSSPGQVTISGQHTFAAASSIQRSYQNGMHPRQSANHRLADTGVGGVRKRPLFLIRTETSASASIFSPGSVGSGRTSGSEHEDTSQYECDSEGTSATSNSELSFERRSDRDVGGSTSGNSRTSESHPSLRKRRGLALHKSVTGELSLATASKIASDQLQYTCLIEVFRSALNLVLDHFYKNRGGYKLSAAEKRMNVAFSTDLAATSTISKTRPAIDAIMDEGDSNDKKLPSRKEMTREGEVVMHLAVKNAAVPEKLCDGKHQQLQQQQEDVFFQLRKQRLLNMLGQFSGGKPVAFSQPLLAIGGTQIINNDSGPPFTIQRIAEVLVSPERYYSQTHKLCNCLEKLLLVTSSASAFGGSVGGDTSESRREATELAALSEEKGRLRSEFRQSYRRQRRKTESPLSDDAEETGGLVGASQSKNESSPESHSHSKMSVEDGGRAVDEDDEDSQQQSLTSLNAAMSREMLEAAARASLRTKFDHVGIDPHSSAAVSSRDARSMTENRGRTNSPPPPSHGTAANSGIVLPGGHSGLLRQHNLGSPTSPNSPDKDHASALGRASSPILFSSSGCDRSSPPMAPIHANIANVQLLQMHHAAAMAGVMPYHLVALNASVSGGAAPAPGPATKDMDLDSRSSASSDVDSESDVSFDDSASDRSDGSDSGQHFEPLTAARAMALNRMQQQQRLQSRVLTSLQTHGGGGEGFRPPADSEYQSGDSIDSTRAEDSGGSDSSSSDLAD